MAIYDPPYWHYSHYNGPTIPWSDGGSTPIIPPARNAEFAMQIAALDARIARMQKYIATTVATNAANIAVGNYTTAANTIAATSTVPSGDRVRMLEKELDHTRWALRAMRWWAFFATAGSMVVVVYDLLH